MSITPSPLRLLLGPSLGFFLGIGTVAAQHPAETPYDWLPVVAEDMRMEPGSESTTRQVILPVESTMLPKATADISAFTKEYVIDLPKFGISNDGTNPEATSKGMNAALQDARTQGANRIVFPKGTYLISEADPIVFNHQNTVVDMNGSTLQINTNGLPSYAVVVIADEALNFRLTNGELRGDRDTHDYTTIEGTHEHGRLLRFAGGRELEVDHLTLTKASGFGVVTTSMGGQPGRAGLLAMIPHWILIRDIESGAFSDDGQEVPSKAKTRTRKAYDLTKCGTEFEFGWTEGFMGFPFIKDRNYQIAFYGPDMKFLKKVSGIQFKKVSIPSGAKFVRLEFNQPVVAAETSHPGATGKAGYCGRITNFRPPTDVHFHHNTIVYNRALGLAFRGGIKWVIEENHFKRNGGQLPNVAADFEGGWELTQNIIFRKNTFNNNANDLSIGGGTELLFESNKFEKAVIVLGRTFNYTFADNIFSGGWVSYATRSGILKVHGNTYKDLKEIRLSFDGSGIADGFLRLPGQVVHTPPISLERENLVRVGKVSGTYIKFVDSKLDQVRLIAGKSTGLVWLQNCEVEDTSLFYAPSGPSISVFIDKTKNLLEEGPGLSRKKEIRVQAKAN